MPSHREFPCGRSQRCHCPLLACRRTADGERARAFPLRGRFVVCHPVVSSPPNDRASTSIGFFVASLRIYIFFLFVFFLYFILPRSPGRSCTRTYARGRGDASRIPIKTVSEHPKDRRSAYRRRRCCSIIRRQLTLLAKAHVSAENNFVWYLEAIKRK